MIEPIVKAIEVPCGQKMAFEVFLNEMDTWWPLDKYSVSAMEGKPAKAIRVEAAQGGQIAEVGPDGNEHLWGRIKAYEPHNFFSMDFHIPQPGEEVKERGLVEVRFVALGDERTRVELTHSNWQAFGKRGQDLRNGYGSGWNVIFESAYMAACCSNYANINRGRGMDKFMIAYYGGSRPKSKEEGAAQMLKWSAWVKGLGKSVVNPGTPLMGTKIVTLKATQEDADPNSLKGFAVIQAGSMEAALEIAKTDPFLATEGTIRVSQMLEMK